MHRKDLLQRLYKYKVSDFCKKYDGQIDFTDRIINFIENNSDCFKRELLKGHITGSCLLLNTDKNKILLTHHKKLNRWLELGGHADGCSDILEVSVKEAQEESGIDDIELVLPDIFDVDIHYIPDWKDVKGHYHYDVRFLLKTKNTDNYVISEESNDLKWFCLNNSELLNLDNPPLQRCIKKISNFI